MTSVSLKPLPCSDLHIPIDLVSAGGVINALLRQLEVMRQGVYVSPRVVQGIFNYCVEA